MLILDGAAVCVQLLAAEEKKSQSITEFWENIASAEDQRMAAMARRRVVMEEHTTNVTQSVFQQDQG
ncbi:67_t:CDS:2 [Paraglomus occultum]|uniref:67_t:CDS:1 n=1 Tax=Paraglomus occultum TaxID=144539 RepID=A0A9N9BUW2_9GLOM|nr:67_t:CDS:2 [Paraglomus occultum]